MNKQPMMPISLSILVFAFLSTAVSGCGRAFWGGYGDTALSLEEFEVYVEQVFRLQNRLTNEVMLLSLRSEDLDRFEDIFSAENRMHELCNPLNEYVVKSMDDQSAGFLLMRRVEKAAVPCERAALQVEALLRQLP